MNRYTITFLLALFVVLASVSLRKSFASIGDSKTSWAMSIGGAPMPSPIRNTVAIGGAPMPPPVMDKVAIGGAPMPPPVMDKVAIGGAPMPAPILNVPAHGRVS